ncbi:hypothetical protein ACLB2K_001793 [Fragaria x ananassa]
MAWEGKIRAVEAAGVRKQQVVESEHLMQALLEQKDGLARRMFTMAGDGWHQWTYNRLASGSNSKTLHGYKLMGVRVSTPINLWSAGLKSLRVRVPVKYWAQGPHSLATGDGKPTISPHRARLTGKTGWWYAGDLSEKPPAMVSHKSQPKLLGTHPGSHQSHLDRD